MLMLFLKAHPRWISEAQISILSHNFHSMKNSFLLFMFIGVFFTGIVSAQSLTPIVVASSGGYFTSGSGSISATVAEMTMVQTFESSGIFLTQGFQQIVESYTAIEETAEDFDVFPNPTSGKFTITVDAKESGSVRIRLYNLLGLIVHSETLDASDGDNLFDFDISGFDVGVYLLEFTVSNSTGQIETGTVKINLIND
ncbi:MAG: hypothetical protein A2W93_00245 [Bacteroidetes bacterium GWF2_43_63]|nr:MAG: hypothetical protein A2W94_13275 [Bacteroidetes bacterium GWE2_42_42]OFY53836.1 MAG: hypothetical protein A2W93_00245 [Bacteroidetes bacterium GWF2_43_63]HBG69792.1 hypothetical protein [Bacteroidales bacterium]HCB61010.1 hypothetical protein [Bacteroidales bacterium]HCY24566.1 hypothetical protein [Bacteroidales bacterium]